MNLVAEPPAGFRSINCYQESFRSESVSCPNRSPEIPEALDAYGWMVGSWEMEVIRFWNIDVADGIKCKIHAGWVREGRGVQNVWIMSRKSDRHAQLDKKMKMYGTTLRVWDPEIGAWRITWRDPIGGLQEEEIGRRIGRNVVQTGVRLDGTTVRWTFTDITPHSFLCLGESPEADGTWKIQGELRARRLATAG